MIIDRYPPRRLFRLVPDLPQTFEPELAQLDQLLEDDAISAGSRLTWHGAGRTA